MKNWKTSLLGIASLIAVIAKVINGGPMQAEDYGLIATGVGLIVAKDSNVTGGTKQQ